MKVCAITNVLDEYFNLPIWLAHYGREFGPENCVVVDRGSHGLPGVTTQSVIRTPRTPLDDKQRARAMSAQVSSMLEHYDVVIYTDCDELLVADPARYSGLADYFSRTEPSAWTAIGLELIHRPDEEDPLDPSKPVLHQRAYTQFNAWLCKSLATREPIRWDGGFHASSAPFGFGELYLFHLKMVDLGEALKRAAQLRSFEVVDPAAAPYHRFPRRFMLDQMLSCMSLQTVEMDPALPPLLEQVARSVAVGPNGLNYITDHVRLEQMLRLPERFRDAF